MPLRQAVALPDPRVQRTRPDAPLRGSPPAGHPSGSAGTRISERHAIGLDELLVFLVAYGSASLLHHIHNAELLNEYPNMPAGLSRAGVHAAWLGVSVVGLAGYVLIRSRYRLPGLVVLGLYGALGLDGRVHRWRPPGA